VKALYGFGLPVALLISAFVLVAGCEPPAPPAGACDVKCPTGSRRSGNDCVAVDGNVKCPEGSRFRSGACVPNVRTATVDIQRLIETTRYAKQRKDTLKADFDKKQKALDDKQARLLDEKKLLESGKLSDTAKRVRIQAYEKELAELQKMYVAFQNELKEKEKATVASMIERVREIASKMGEQEGFEVVFVERDVLWARTGASPEKLAGIPRDDLTDAIARELDKEP
jgi:Skp family chaperone for outer membrane proteins